jgi:hypothetical protein
MAKSINFGKKNKNYNKIINNYIINSALFLRKIYLNNNYYF